MQNYIVINSSKLTDNKWLSSFLSNLNYAWQTVCKTGPIWRIHNSPQERRTNMTWNQKTESPRQTSKRPFSTYNWVYLLGSYWYIALTLAIKLYDISLTIFKNGFRLGNSALIKMSSYQYRKSQRWLDRLISTMGFPILVRWHLYIESGPCYFQYFLKSTQQDNRDVS